MHRRIMGNQAFPTNWDIKIAFCDKQWGSLHSSNLEVPRTFDTKKFQIIQKSSSECLETREKEAEDQSMDKMIVMIMRRPFRGRLGSAWMPQSHFSSQLANTFFYFKIFPRQKIYILSVDCVHDDDNRREEEWCDEADVALVRSLKGCRFFSRSAYGRHLPLCPNALKVSPQ